MQKALIEITINIQSYLNPFSPFVGSLTTFQRHIVTSPYTYRHWRRTFLGTSHVVLNVQWDFF